MDNLKTFLDGLARFSQYYLSGDFLSDLVSTLTRPSKALIPLEYKSRTSEINPKNEYDPWRGRISSRLYAFVFASLLTGTLFYTYQSTTTRSADLASFPELVLYPVWFIYGCTIFVIATALRGKGEFWETISACLQILSAIFVASSLVAFVWSRVVLVGVTFGLTLDFPEAHSMCRLLIDYPWTLYYFSEFVLVAVYTLPTLKSLHRLASIPRMITSILPASICFSFALLMAFSSPLTPIGKILERVEQIVPDVFQPGATTTPIETSTPQPIITPSGTPTPTYTPSSTSTNIPWEPTRTRKPREHPTPTLEIPTNTVEPTNPPNTIEPTDSPKPTRTPKPTDRPDDDDHD